MSLGIVMMVHEAFKQAEQVARHWATSGCPVVIHVDKRIESEPFSLFRQALSDLPNVQFCKRFRGEWGTWGLVAASQAAAEQLLRDHPQVRHVYLTSGSCLPLRPVADLRAYLEARPRTDFIESSMTMGTPWTMGGLDYERFTLRFPFSWKRQRRLFDGCVALQRRFGLKRRIPPGIDPHMGSQWWCLTRQTLTAILQDPDRKRFERYFRGVWIPDESYFQTLARRYSTALESRSLTLSKFDTQGKPYVFYDDHLPLLRRSDCFMVRKVWPQAHRLYDTFLSDATPEKPTEPNPGAIDQTFARAVERRVRGRAGLYMQSRFPNTQTGGPLTAAPYSVFQGFSELFEDFEPWLARSTRATVHGPLFDPDRVGFTDGQQASLGGLTDQAALRDRNPQSFLTNLIWNTRGARQCFQFSPGCRQNILQFMARDPNAEIAMISGAWAIPLFRSNLDFQTIRDLAARYQQTEQAQLELLTATQVQARLRLWSLAEFVEAPSEPLQAILEQIAPQPPLWEAPRMVDLTGLSKFLQNLRNHGLTLRMMAEFPGDPDVLHAGAPPAKPYLINK